MTKGQVVCQVMRTPRKQCESQIYHVISRGTGRQLIFEDNDDRELFLNLLARTSQENEIEILAWCLMGNHVHLLLRSPLPIISHCMKTVCGRYAQLFNQRHGRTGHLFQERFKSEPVEDEAYCMVVVSYIHFNPEKAGIAKQGEYRWSSYGEYVGRTSADSLCSTGFVLDLFGGVEGFRKYHANHAADASCMDVDNARSRTRAMPDEAAIVLAEEVLAGTPLSSLKTFDRTRRDEALRKLLAAGLSVRQIERLTGISRGIVQAART